VRTNSPAAFQVNGPVDCRPLNDLYCSSLVKLESSGRVGRGEGSVVVDSVLDNGGTDSEGDSEGEGPAVVDDSGMGIAGPTEDDAASEEDKSVDDIPEVGGSTGTFVSGGFEEGVAGLFIAVLVRVRFGLLFFGIFGIFGFPKLGDDQCNRATDTLGKIRFCFRINESTKRR
jgi:hypothetical protein